MMTLDDLNARFIWTKDSVDSWRILDNPTGALIGDCDDYAATALWIAEGCSMGRFWKVQLTGKALFWVVAGRSFASHVVLWHHKYGWIDNQNPQWGPKKDKLRYPVVAPLVAAKMLLGKF